MSNLNPFEVGYTTYIGLSLHDTIEEYQKQDTDGIEDPNILIKSGAYFFSMAIDFYLMIQTNPKIPSEEKKWVSIATSNKPDHLLIPPSQEIVIGILLFSFT